MASRTRVGVIGCGLIAQVMHLPYLAELSDRFELAALCDLSEDVLAACQDRYRVERGTTDWEELVAEPLDAVLVLTSGNHAPMAVAAADAGLHVFVEKPMAISASEGARMVAAARSAGVQLMVGTMKRYDPAYERLIELLPTLADVRLVRATTLESPLEPYVAHYPLTRPGAPVASAVVAAMLAEEERHLDAALGRDADADTRWCYRNILLDNLVHELNMLRGALGEPTAVSFASLERHRVAIHLSFGATDCHLSWVDLPGIARYRQELAFYAPDGRLVLTLPSPFLRSAPSLLTIEGGEAGTPHAWEREEVVAFDEAFKRELLVFHDAILTGAEPRTAGLDGLRDLHLCEAIARVQLGGEPIADPTALPAAVAAPGGG
ncbi:MAG TPA: Gfo/Idh/MocA family oxidoreductase [Solirubrobacteraceae bacterium]